MLNNIESFTDTLFNLTYTSNTQKKIGAQIKQSEEFLESNKDIVRNNGHNIKIEDLSIIHDCS